MMKLKKRKKSRKFRGERLHGKAAKKHKGKGNIGGKGMSGTGKRADQKKTLIRNLAYDYFGSKGKIYVQAQKYILLIIFNFLFVIIAMYALVDEAGIHYLVSKLAIIGIVVAWNFIAYKFFVYK